jgi:hypothetical protein
MINRQAADKEVRGAQLCHCCGGGFFEIHVRGHLGSQWSEWLGGLQMKLVDNGEMILAGYLADQAALMGILTKLCGLNLTLLSVNIVEQKL